MRVLITGFEPFGGERFNASGEAARRLALGYRRDGVELVTEILPVSFERGPAALRSAIAAHGPDVVLAVGEAGGRRVVTPETTAVNDQQARIPDNDGATPSGPLDDGPRTLPSRLPVEALVLAVRGIGVPAEASDDAGRFVCNAVFRAALTGFAGPAGFVHVPALRPVGRAAVGAETDPVPSGDVGAGEPSAGGVGRSAVVGAGESGAGPVGWSAVVGAGESDADVVGRSSAPLRVDDLVRALASMVDLLVDVQAPSA